MLNNNEILNASIFSLAQLRRQCPLVHNISNYVSMDIVANSLLAIGASPIMAHAIEELEEIIAITNAVCINIGTLDSNWIQSMTLCLKYARARDIPVVLDPVGAGASKLRTTTSLQLLSEGGVCILRANASEISALAGQVAKTKGVDSTDSSDSVIDSAKHLVDRFNCVVVVSGETDYVLSKENCYAVKNGHNIMPRVTALGCTCSAIIAAFASLKDIEPVIASVAAMLISGICGELAAETSKGPASFRVSYIDALYSITPDIIKEKAKVKAL